MANGSQRGRAALRSGNYRRVFRRSQQNPIISALDLPFEAAAVYNPGAALVDGETVLLLRVEDLCGYSSIYTARSPNGVDNWRFEREPLLAYGVEGYRYEAWGCEDPRVVYVPEDACWYITYVAFSSMGPAVAIARTYDFYTAERLLLVGPSNDKDGVLFPGKVGNRYMLFHRPDLGISEHIWSALSPDLVHWGEPHSSLREGLGPAWDAVKVGAGPPPIKLSEGWLLLYHGVKAYGNAFIYRCGGALFDLEKPYKYTARSSDWIFQPEVAYETTGHAPNVVFPSGATLQGDELWMYYGAADTYVCLATAKLRDVIDAAMA